MIGEVLTFNRNLKRWREGIRDLLWQRKCKIKSYLPVIILGNAGELALFAKAQQELASRPGFNSDRTVFGRRNARDCGLEQPAKNKVATRPK